MHLALLIFSVSMAGQSPAAMPPAPAWTISPGAEILARIDLLGCPEGNVLDWVKPSAEVDRYFQRPRLWGDEWINALTAPPRWKIVEDLTGDPRDELAVAIGGKLYIYTQSRGPENPKKVYAPVRRSVISFPGWSAG